MPITGPILPPRVGTFEALPLWGRFFFGLFA
jgi:hypothetical protein